MEVIVVSIGALSKNPLWGEKVAVRSSHATTTLIRQGDQNLLVDPSLPPQLLEARLLERTGLKADAITQVFLTNWRPVHRRALTLFEKARWTMNSVEKEAAERVLAEAMERAGRQEEEGAAPAREVEQLVRSEEALLKRVEPAGDELADGVDLFPLPGYTEGQAGLLVATATLTTIIAGDAVPTAGHFTAGQVFADCWDVERAKGSLMEMYEIADVIVPGHDNLFIVPRASGM